MSKAFKIDFKEDQIQKDSTKFGGQPKWYSKPEWPISKSTGNPMRFICQIRLNDINLNGLNAKYAYLFMTDEEDYVDDTWKPDGGENAIILQPGNNDIRTEEILNGPTTYKMIKEEGNPRLVQKEIELGVHLTQFDEKDEDEIVNKMTGDPDFIQGKEYPFGDDNWKLLIQINSGNVPFSLNFGDYGVGYGFINNDGNKAKFLWQG